MNTDSNVPPRGMLQTGGVDSILAGLWRKILIDLDVDDSTLLDKIDRYSKKATKDQPERAAQIRGNLRTDVNKEAMTWYTFTKCLQVLGVEYMEIKFTLHHLRMNSIHLLTVPLNEKMLIADEDDEEKDPKEPTLLSTFFKGILHNLGVGVNMFESLLEQYMRREKVSINLRNKTHIRGYLKKDFSAPKMSWKSFVKGMIFLCVLKMNMEASLRLRKNQLSTHHYEVLLGDVEDYNEELKNELGL